MRSAFLLPLLLAACATVSVPESGPQQVEADIEIGQVDAGDGEGEAQDETAARPGRAWPALVPTGAGQRIGHRDYGRGRSACTGGRA